MISSTVTSATSPPVLPISSRAIWPSDLPSRRMEQNRMVKSCTAPPSTAPNKIQSRPGQIAELRRERRADERSRSGNSSEMMAEQNPFICRLEIVTVAEFLGRRRAAVVERHDLRGDEFTVEPEPDQENTHGRGDDPEAVYRLPAAGGDCAQADGRNDGKASPDKRVQVSFHASRFEV